MDRVTCGLVLALLFVSFNLCVESVIVSTSSGILDGAEFTTSGGRTVSAFLGVPYAKPPVGLHRFKESQPPEKWDGVRLAHNFGPKCVQFLLHKRLPDPIYGDEDCLYLNVYTPIVSNTSKLDVIFFIHGGGFVFGTGEVYTPDYLLDHYDVVVVTINYRLGPFGFLTTEDDVIPGNNGLKDQVLALKWVQNNIEELGGDKDKVTIAGLSAGGASVHLHYMSPLSKNLFRQGISLSGSAFCPWVLTENSRSKAQVLAASVGCPTENSKDLLQCLQQIDARTLLSHIEELFWPWNHNPFTSFGVIIEGNSETAFLSKHPYRLVEEGNVKDAPWLTSITTEEGLFPAASFITNEKLLEELNYNWETIAPHLLDYNHTVAQNKLNEVSDKIRTFYFGDYDINKNQRASLVEMISDRLFVVDIERAARLQASVSKSPVYFYTFAYRGQFSLSEELCKCDRNLGVSHADDLCYLLTVKWAPLNTEEDKAMMKTMTNIWMSFIKSGIPSPHPDVVWKPVSPDAVEEGNLNYLKISSSKIIKPKSSSDLGNRKFWDTLPFKELWNAEGVNTRYIDEL